MLNPIEECMQNSSYCLIRSSREVYGRRIYSYILTDTSQQSISRAIETINHLLRNNPRLVVLFPINAAEIQKRPYLTINDTAVCLSDEGATTGQYSDCYFSEAYLKEPILCSENHCLEKKTADLWCQKMNGECPAGGHKVDSFEINIELKNAVTHHKLTIQNACSTERALLRSPQNNAGANNNPEPSYFGSGITKLMSFAFLASPIALNVAYNIYRQGNTPPQAGVVHAQANAVYYFVLNTPLMIYDTAKQDFPQARAKVIMNDNLSCTLHLFLLQNLPPLIINASVDKQAFSKNLLLSNLFNLNQGNGNHLGNLNTADFSVQMPLSNGYHFRRTMYEKKNKKCVDAIVHYLNTSDDSKVMKLGLAPVQVEGNLQEETFVFFKQILKVMEAMDADTKRQLLRDFSAKYPETCREVRSEARKQQVGNHDGGENSFEILYNGLQRRVIGQDMAVRKLAVLLAAQQKSGTTSVYLFVGPTGVGKTELAKAVSNIKNTPFIFLTMNLYQAEMDIARFWGVPPGYKGCDELPFFAKEIEKCKPVKKEENGETIYEVKDVVILFDEFEKANTILKQSLLTLFDEKFCTISYTNTLLGEIRKKYVFTSCVFIATSNLYQEEILQEFVQGKATEEIVTTFKRRNRPSLAHPNDYSQELLGRINIVPFGPIPRGANYQALLKLKLTIFLQNLKQIEGFKEINIENENEILNFLENNLYGNGTDIRKIEKYFTNHLDPLIQQFKGKWGNLDDVKITLFLDEGRLAIQVWTYVHLLGEYEFSGLYS